MGVLMSKRAQVEKVQKVNAVVSAFQAGVKERPVSANQSPEDTPAAEGDGEGQGPDSDAPPTAANQENGGEEAEPVEADEPSTSQHASGQSEEDQKINKEAWGRLRDGKGVEPEDMDKSHQLTPPTFVRPKREADDDQPMEVELHLREQPVSDEVCEVCEVWTADHLFPCRTCERVFHDGCLGELGLLPRPGALQEMRDTAHTLPGWSCHYCDNVNLLLTEEEMYSLMETFKQCKIIPESCLVSDELLQYRHFVSKQLFETDLTDEQEEEVLAQFSALDPDKKGQIEWSDFLYHESLGVLRKFRTENSLVRLLTAKERDRARSVFLGLDRDKDGRVTAAESRLAQQAWYHDLHTEPQSCNVSISHVGPISENSPASSNSSKQDDNRPVSWADFLKESAIYILAARPNSSAMHIRLPL